MSSYGSVNSLGLSGEVCVEGADNNSFVQSIPSMQRDKMFAIDCEYDALEIRGKRQDGVILNSLIRIASFTNSQGIVP